MCACQRRFSGRSSHVPGRAAMPFSAVVIVSRLRRVRSRRLTPAYVERPTAGLRNYDIFDYAINGAA
jgi:hypothetical protein